MDSQARDLERAASAGNAEAGVRLAHLGVRSGNAEYLGKGVHSALSILNYDELRELQYAVGQQIAKVVGDAKTADPKSFGTVKAIEFNLSSLGKVSLGEFVAAVESFARQARKEPDALRGSDLLHRTQQGYGRKTVKQCLQTAEKVFSEYNGDFVIGANGALRIYALKRDLSPEEKLIRKQKLERKKLENQLQKNKDQAAKLKKALEQQKRSEERLKARLQKMESKDGSKT